MKIHARRQPRIRDPVARHDHGDAGMICIPRTPDCARSEAESEPPARITPAPRHFTKPVKSTSSRAAVGRDQCALRGGRWREALGLKRVLAQTRRRTLRLAPAVRLAVGVRPVGRTRAIPLAVMAAGLIVFPIDFLLKMVGVGSGKARRGISAGPVRLAPGALPTGFRASRHSVLGQPRWWWPPRDEPREPAPESRFWWRV